MENQIHVYKTQAIGSTWVLCHCVKITLIPRWANIVLSNLVRWPSMESRCWSVVKITLGQHRRKTFGRYNERLSTSGKRCLAIWFRTQGHWVEGCHTYCDMGHPFIMVISEDLWHSHLLPNVWLPVFTTWVCRGWDSNLWVGSPSPWTLLNIFTLDTHCLRAGGGKLN